MTRRLPIVGVMGSGEAEHAEKAEPLGRWLAGQGVHLLTGAGRGVMTAASRAFQAVPDRAGLVIGIVPCGEAPDVPQEGYPNPFVELARRYRRPIIVFVDTRSEIPALPDDVPAASTLAEVQDFVRRCLTAA
jgi:predicted Rossmann-fold nucleotide-binding protein